MKFLFCSLIALLLLTGCSQRSMTVSSHDGTTGGSRTTHYSDNYDAGDWVVPGEIGISVAIIRQQKPVGPLYSVQQSLGALGPGDLEATAKAGLFIWNRTDQPRQITLSEFVTAEKTVGFGSGPITVAPRSSAFVGIGVIPIFNYATEIPVEIAYLLNGNPGSLKLMVPRRTYEDLRKYYGPTPISPYPWPIPTNKPAS